MRNLADIPEHIPTVKWSWIADAMDRCRYSARRSQRILKGKEKEEEKEKEMTRAADAEVIAGGSGEGDDSQTSPMDYEYLHATYKERVDAGAVPWRIDPIQGRKRQQSGRPIIHPIIQSHKTGQRQPAAEEVSGTQESHEHSHISFVQIVSVSPHFSHFLISFLSLATSAANLHKRKM